MKRVSVYVFLLGLFFWSTVSVTEAQSKKKYQSALVGFYNLENLFDTIDDPAILEEVASVLLDLGVMEVNE